MENTKSTRREFCVHAITLVGVASLVESCGGGGSPTGPSSNAPDLPVISNGTVANGRLTLTIDASSPLNNVGSAAFVNAGGQRLLVAHPGVDTFSAVTAICTHEGCDVTKYQNGTYVCPCHGSEYSTSGAVTKGPATRSLSSFPTQFTNSVLTITL